MIMNIVNGNFKLCNILFVTALAATLTSCATKKVAEPVEPTEPKVVTSFAPVKNTDQQLVSDLIETETELEVEPTIATIQNSDPLLNGTINSQTTVEGAAVNSEAVVDPITPETVATDAESVEPLSVDDKQAIDKLIEITESDGDLCIVTVENDCINETVE